MTREEQLTKINEDKVKRMNEEVGHLSYYDCPICKNKGVVFISHGITYSFKDCECKPIRHMHEMIHDSGLKSQFDRCTLESFKHLKPHHKIMKERALTFIDNPTRAIIFSGMTGVGKSHISVAILNELLKKHYEFTYLNYANEFTQLQLDLKNFNEDISDKARKRLKEISTVKVLYIDDFLKVGSYDNVFDLINARYIDNDLITIISTERTNEEIKRIDMAVHGRLREMCGKDNWINIGYDENKNERLKIGE